MGYEEVLLVGGAQDGRRVTVLKGVSTLQIPQLQQRSSYTSESASAPVTREMVYLEYRRERVQGRTGRVFEVFTYGEVDPIAALIEGYRKP